MTNSTVRFFSVAIATSLAGCNALSKMAGDGRASSTPEPVARSFPGETYNPVPQTSQETTPRPAVASSVGGTPTPKQTTPAPLEPTARPTVSSTPTPFPCPSETEIMLGFLQPIQGRVGRTLYFQPRCNYTYDKEAVAPASIGGHLWIFMGKINEYSTWYNVFRMDQVDTNGSVIFSRRQIYFGSSINNRYLYDFRVPNEGGGDTLPGDVESRASSSLTFTEQGKSRFGSSTFEWPCAQDEEYAGVGLTESNPADTPDLSSRIFAVGDRYIVRSVGAYQYERDGNGEWWLTARKVIQAVRRDGRAFKIIRKYQWPDKEIPGTYERWSMNGGSWGMDSFVWSVQLKAFIRNPYEFGLLELPHYLFEVLTEEDLDTLLAANEGSPCGIE